MTNTNRRDFMKKAVAGGAIVSLTGVNAPEKQKAQAVEGSVPLEDPPEWATLERELIEQMNGAVDPIIEKFVEDDGEYKWPPDDYVGIDAVDDAYEAFTNWPLFYLMGGDEKVYNYALSEWEAITDQFSDISTGLGWPQIVKEYQQGHDWFHQGEGNVLFYLLGMADPNNEDLIERAERFAGFYLNEGSDVPDLYDPDKNILKSPMNGSKGPGWHNWSRLIPPPMYNAHSETRIPWQYSEWKESYGLPFYDVPGVGTVQDLKDPEKAERMGMTLSCRTARGDVPQNLGSTSLVTNAFLLTGDEKYKNWVADYTEGWLNRQQQNGLIPDNVGLSEGVGEYLPGDNQWFGGWYGWIWPHGWHGMGAGVTIGAENAMLLQGGDQKYLDLPADQLRYLMERGEENEGVLEVPYRYAHEGEYPSENGQVVPESEDSGWFDWSSVSGSDALYTAHIWYMSQTEAHKELFERLRPYSEDDDAYRSVPPSTGKGRKGGHIYQWAAYLDGNFPEYPTQILERNLSEVKEVDESNRNEDPAEVYDSDSYLHDRNPIYTEGLLQCTMGSPQGIYYGGLPMAHLRHFDPARQRPGLPEDVAALITNVDSERTILELVNLSEEKRDLIIQAGGFGEHQFTAVRPQTDQEATTNSKVQPGGNGKAKMGEGTPTLQTGNNGNSSGASGTKAIHVALEGRSRMTLEIAMERFVNKPTYQFPWSA